MRNYTRPPSADNLTSPHEDEECVAFVCFLEHEKHRGRILAFTHIPASTRTRFLGVLRKNKSMGVRRGFSEYAVIVSTPGRNNGATLIFVEMKRRKGGTVSAEQKEWIRHLEASGIPARVCRGCIEAKAFVEGFFV